MKPKFIFLTMTIFLTHALMASDFEKTALKLQATKR